jgi:hypothetical protein
MLIQTDLADPNERKAFSNCLIKDPKFGIESAGVIDGEGDFYRILLSTS